MHILNHKINLPQVLSLPINNLEAYIHSVQSIPLLTPEEEQSYALRLKQNHDLQAAQKLILSHLRFVVKIAKGFMGYGLALADLIQEGNIGLMKAVKRFNPDLGVRLVSFAVHWIKSEIHDFIIKNWRMVKIATTKAQRKLFFNLRSSHKRLGFMNQAEIQDIARELKVKESEVIEMEQRMNAYDMHFDAPIEDEEQEAFSPNPAQFLSAPEAYNPEATILQDQESVLQDKLKNALDSMDERTRHIIHARWLDEKKATLHALAEQYNISPERVRQLETRAFKTLRQLLSA